MARAKTSQVAARAFASRITKLRDDLELSQSGLATAVGVSQTCVWNWENGHATPRPDALRKLARVLKSSREFLLTGDLAPPGSSADAEHGNQETLPGMISRVRKEIAGAANVEIQQVKIVIEYSN